MSFRRQNGSYRYKRNVPKKLRHLIGKDTLYRQLGESYSEAMKVLPKVHLEIEQLFAAEETMPANERALTFIRAALGEEVAALVSAGQVVEYSPEDYALNDLAQTIAWQTATGGGEASLQRQATVAAHDTGYSLK
jgi:hypothetical protein